MPRFVLQAALTGALAICCCAVSNAEEARSALFDEAAARLTFQPQAQDAESDAAAPAGPPPISFLLRGDGEYYFDTDLENDEGNVSVARAGASVGVRVPRGRFVFGLDLSEEVSFYDFDLPDSFLGGDDVLETGHTVTLAPLVQGRINDRWGWMAAGRIRFGFESGADIGDSTVYAGLGSVRYQVNESLALSFGGAFQTRLEEDPIVIPIIGVEWQINERVRLSFEGVRATLTADLNETLAVSLSGGWQLREYRLEDDGGPLSDGILTDSRWPVGVGLTWKPKPGVSITLRGGATVYQEYDFLDDDGDEIADSNSDAAPYVALLAEFRF